MAARADLRHRDTAAMEKAVAGLRLPSKMWTLLINNAGLALGTAPAQKPARRTGRR
jgi:NADP-dependent 3-hydroxy acid dehydrogenase YdfG